MSRRKHTSILILLYLVVLIILPVFLCITPINDSMIASNENLNAEAYSEVDVVAWWNSNWEYRYKLTIKDANISTPINITQVDNYPLDVYLTFDPGTCYNDSIRVVY